MRDITYESAIANSAALRSLGQTEIYLSAGEMPWAKATTCEPGGTHRLDMATSVWFGADHESGLHFRWSFDIESRSANGTGSYAIDVEACREVMKKLGPDARQKFAEYLFSCAEKVKAKGAEYQRIADRQYADAHLLRMIGQG